MPYKSLPLQWEGTCTIARLGPFAGRSKNLTFTFQHSHYPVRNKHGVSHPSATRPITFHEFVRALFPHLGVAELEQAIDISTTLEMTQNATVDALMNLQMETVCSHNRLSKLIGSWIIF